MSGIFGWSYPPGVSSVPGDEPNNCDMCWRDEMRCRCDECPVCEEIGNPDCYMNHSAENNHGLIETENQRAGRREVIEDSRIFE